jgi:hypothetical protein
MEETKKVVKINKSLIISMALLVVGLGVGFFGGFKYRNYQLSKIKNTLTQGGPNGATQRYVGGARTGNQNVGSMMNRGGVSGSVISIDNNSMTVKLVDGSTKIVLLSGSTIYSKTATTSASDLKSGLEVAVFGTSNSDGSVTATSVQINPTSIRPQASPAPIK